jgi:hypothetical protein
LVSHYVFWLIVVCPRCCLCFRLPPPFLPAPAVATDAVCRAIANVAATATAAPVLSTVIAASLYASKFPTASMFQRCFDRHRHHSSSLQVVWR